MLKLNTFENAHLKCTLWAPLQISKYATERIATLQCEILASACEYKVGVATRSRCGGIFHDNQLCCKYIYCRVYR